MKIFRFRDLGAQAGLQQICVALVLLFTCQQDKPSRIRVTLGLLNRNPTPNPTT